MATSVFTAKKPLVATTKTKQPLGGLSYDRFMIILTSWFIGGLYLDGWAHSHIPQLETFFTPWHGVLYSGYLVCAILIVAAVAINRHRGYAWRESVPAGYELSLLGVPLFAIGGVADMIWHILFGIEKGVEPLLSPTHLLLALSAMLIMSGPFRAAWRRSDSEAKHSWRTLFPMLFSFLATYSLFTFFTEFAHPFVRFWLVTQALDDQMKSFGVACVLLQAGLLMGFVLLALKRWQLPFGAFTFVLTLNAALMSVFSDQYRMILVAFAAGLVADLLIKFLRLSSTRLDTLRIFAFIVPVVYYLGYFILLMSMDGITWKIHLWLGSSFMAGIVGLVLSFLLVPPLQAVETRKSR